MPLPNDDDLKKYLRIETADDDETLFDIVEEATALAETLIRRPILATEKTLVGSASLDEFNRQIIRFRPFPIGASPAPVLTDSEGDVVASSDYTVLGGDGILRANSGASFSYSSPYQLVAHVGLQFAPDYESRILPNLRTLILGLASIIYHERNPGASSESEAGDSVSYASFGIEEESLPGRLRMIVRSLRAPRV